MSGPSCLKFSWLRIFLTGHASRSEVFALNPAVVVHILVVQAKTTALLAWLQLCLAVLEMLDHVFVGENLLATLVLTLEPLLRQS